MPKSSIVVKNRITPSIPKKEQGFIKNTGRIVSDVGRAGKKVVTVPVGIMQGLANVSKAGLSIGTKRYLEPIIDYLLGTDIVGSRQRQYTGVDSKKVATTVGERPDPYYPINAADPKFSSVSPAALDIIDRFAKYANEAYASITSNETELKEVAEAGGIWFYDDESKEDLEGFCVYDTIDDVIVVSFKGSARTDDFIKDAKFVSSTVTTFDDMPLPFPLQVHTGFMQRFTNLFESMKEALATVQQNIMVRYEKVVNTVVFTGHSLGGALACLAAVIFTLLKNNFERKLGINRFYFISFEAPRVFTQTTVNDILTNPLTAALDTESVRIYKDGDPVVNGPLFEQGFAHLGQSIRMNHPDEGGFIGFNNHSMDSKLQFISENKRNPAAFQVMQARGVIKKKRTSKAMKDKMAYVRSFKKK